MQNEVELVAARQRRARHYLAAGNLRSQIANLEGCAPEPVIAHLRERLAAEIAAERRAEGEIENLKMRCYS